MLPHNQILTSDLIPEQGSLPLPNLVFWKVYSWTPNLKIRTSWTVLGLNSPTTLRTGSNKIVYSINFLDRWIIMEGWWCRPAPVAWYRLRAAPQWMDLSPRSLWHSNTNKWCNKPGTPNPITTPMYLWTNSPVILCNKEGRLRVPKLDSKSRPATINNRACKVRIYPCKVRTFKGRRWGKWRRHKCKCGDKLW